MAFVVPASAQALVIGISDQQPGAFADPRMRALGLHDARLIVPWDVASSDPASVNVWLAAVQAAGMTPHIAFGHLRSDQCPGRPCVTPTRAQYHAAVAAFHARWPQITYFTTWNEANHVSQPIATNPEADAGYYEELVSVCPTCTIVAGDVLDSGSYVRYLQRFMAATKLNPQLWGLHNYGDTTYQTTTGTDAMLNTVPGQVWLEETGGIVTLRDSKGRETLSANESRAAKAVDQAFAIARDNPRITRMYIYQWQTGATADFDAGLMRPDGTARPSYTEVVKGIVANGGSGTQGPIAAPTTSTAAKAPSYSIAWSGKRLVLALTCRSSDKRCAGKLTFTLRTKNAGAKRYLARKLTTRSYKTTAAHPKTTIKITVSKALRTRARKARSRQIQLTVKPTLPAGRTTKVTRAVKRPNANA